jgi:NAD(P)-dependent dehydrogenase (short-subunit alcohol dehydrogenase family)
MSKTIVITGSSSGIGKATAKYFAEKDWKVAATMRTPKKETELQQHENITLYQLDVTDEDSIAKATKQIINDFGTVDVVLNNAGYGLMGPFEATTPEQIRHQFDVNVFGLMSVTRAFLPHFRANKSGMFLNVSSIGGRVTFPFISLYHSSKWAVEGFSESLSYELGELGIQVKIIEPGGVETDFGGRSLVFATKEGLTDYDKAVGQFQANMANSGLSYSTAEFLAEAIYNATTDGKTQMRYLVGPDAEQVYGTRQKVGDDAFIAGMKERMFS